MLYIGNAWKGKTPRTWHHWNIKIPKPPCISSLKINGLLCFWKFLGLSEENYNLQSLWITLYKNCEISNLKTFFFFFLSNCLQAVWKYSNERIMTWMQEAARRIDISKRSFLIETISSQYVTYAFSHLYPSPPWVYANISAFGVFRKRVIRASWGCPQAVWLSFPDDPRGIKSGRWLYPGWPGSLKPGGEYWSMSSGSSVAERNMIR